MKGKRSDGDRMGGILMILTTCSCSDKGGGNLCIGQGISSMAFL